jgi:hypothetical protein
MAQGVGLRTLGDNASSLVYTPVAPCRIIDTTLAGGPIAAGTQRDFFVAADEGFPGQGGQAGGCGVPLGPATAVMINLVAVAPAGPGNLRAFAFGSPAPSASIINYASLPPLNIANGIALQICNTALATCTLDLTVQADVSATHLVADVVGFFEAAVTATPLHAVVTSAGGLARGFHAASATRPQSGRYSVLFDRDVRSCTYAATIGDPSTGTESAAFVSVASLPADASGVYVEVRDRDSKLVNRGFHLVVLC